MTFEIENIPAVILQEIANPKLKQTDIAKTYLLAIQSREEIDWPKINQAIVARWSKFGLNRIKTMAWGMMEPK